jgi:type IV pilus assembly protein PilV
MCFAANQQSKPPVQRWRQNCSDESGFSIIEVLVAIIILSIGMLGAVGMQTTAMQSNKETRNQAAATTFARDLAERMRGNNAVAVRKSNSPGGNPYLFDMTLTAPGDVSIPSRNCFTDANGCPIKEDAASWDVFDWQSRVQQELPNPRVKVCFDKDPFDSTGTSRWACTDEGDIAVLKISWNRNNTGGKLVFTGDAGNTPALVMPLTAGNQ